MMPQPLVPSVKYGCTGRLNADVLFDLGLEDLPRRRKQQVIDFVAIA